MFAINIFIIVSVVIVAQAAIVKPRLLNPVGEQFAWPVTWTLSGSPNVAFGVFISWLLLVSRACPSWAWQWQAEGCVCVESAMTTVICPLRFSPSHATFRISDSCLAQLRYILC